MPVGRERMKSLLNRVRDFFDARGRFFRDIVTIISGTVASRIIALAALPIISRIYTPAEFGVLALFRLTVVFVACIASGRYEVALVLPEDKRDASHLLAASVIIATFSSCVAGILFWFFRDQITMLLGAEELNFWLLVAPFIIWILSIANIAEFWVTRSKAFGYLSIGEISGTTVNVSTQIILYLLFKPGAAGLISGQIGHMLTTLIVCWRGAIVNDALTGLKDFSPKRMLELIRRYKSFPLYDAWANLLNVSSREFPVLILGVFFTSTVVGFYSVGYRIMSMPVAVISRNVMRAFLPKATEGYAEGRLDDLLMKLLQRMLVVAMTPVLLVMVAGPEVINVVLGPSWEGAGIYIQWLSVFILTMFISPSLLQTLTVMEMQRQRLIYQALLVGGRGAGLIVGGLQGDPVMAIALASVIGALVDSCAVLYVLRCSGVPISRTVGTVGAELLRALPFVMILLSIKTLYPEDLIVFFAFGGVLLLYAALNRHRLLGQPSNP